MWSLERAGAEETGNPMRFLWSKIGNFAVDGREITADVLAYDPTIFKWMGFLTGCVLPKDYHERVGAEGFEAAPVGSGSYKAKRLERGAFVRLLANEDSWGGRPPFDAVTVKFVTDAASRVAEVESGSSDATLEISCEEFDRLRARAGLAGVTTPISDMGMILLDDVGHRTDRDVRLAAAHAIDKRTLIDRLLPGYDVPIDTLQTPEHAAITVPCDPDLAVELLAASGCGPDDPVRFTVQTRRGFMPKDYEMMQAIVGLWRRVGIEAEIEVYEIALHYELRGADELAPATFYSWGNAVGDPSTSTGFAMFGPSPHSVWDGEDLEKAIGALWGEPDEARRIEGCKAVDRPIAEEAYVIPLLQYVQPIVHREGIEVTPSVSGALGPQRIRPS